MKSMDELVEVMRKLRSPDGCPWDRKQTHQSLMPFIMEEVGELLDAIDKRDQENCREELGDVLMHIVLHSVIAEEEKAFTFDDVVRHVTAKMIHRHPHVFSGESVRTAEEVVGLWDKIKSEEKGHEFNPEASLLDGVPCHAPALIQAEKLQKKAAKVGFDWSSQDQILEKIEEEVGELKEAMKQGNDEEIDSELGDLLFAAANLSRFRKRESAELLLARSSKKFKRRFQFIEKSIRTQGKKIEECSLQELDALWNKAKKEEKKS